MKAQLIFDLPEEQTEFAHACAGTDALLRENYNKGYMPEQEVQSYPNKNKTMSFVFRNAIATARELLSKCKVKEGK